MPYTGYLSYAGTEILNAERTAAYVRALTPLLSVGDGLPDADDTRLSQWLGDSPYDTPIQDNPPWLSTFRPESTEFAGVVPLGLQGFDDGLADTPITELNREGASIGRMRRPSRSLRMTGLLVASTEKGLDFGHSWLRGVLSEASCDACSGETLCYLAATPEPCDDNRVRQVLDVNYAAFQGESDDMWSPTAQVDNGWAMFDPMLPGDEASYVVDGLIPGAVYRVDLGLDTSTAPPQWDSRWTLSIAGIPSSIGINGTAAGVGEYEGTGVLEFTATDVRHRVVLRLDVGSQVVPRVTHLRVLRMPFQTVVGIAGLAGDPGEKFAWTPMMPEGVSASAVWVNAAGYSFTGTSGAPGTIGLTSIVRNLINGEDYTLRIGVWAQNDDLESRPLQVTVDGVTVQGPLVNPSPPQIMWVTVPFTASDIWTTIQVTNQLTWVLPENATEVKVRYMRLERRWETDNITPVVDSTLLRSFRNVTLTSGPSTLQEYSGRAGYIRRVEWTMQAGVPRPQGQPVDIPAPMLGPLRYPEIDCQGGEPILHNLLPNPSFESPSGGTGWTLAGSGYSGAAAQFANLATTGEQVYAIAYGGEGEPGQGTFMASAQAVQELTRYTFSIDVTSDSFGLTNPGLITVQATTSVALMWVDQPVFSLRPGDKQRVWGTFVTRPGMTSVSVGLTFTTHRGPEGDTTVMALDAAMLSTSARDFYVDGSIPGGSWDGTAWASKSTWASPQPDVVADPDCPPPPMPPRPPAIVNECISTPSSWLRHVVVVPESASQVGASAFPVITLITGADAVRNVRVRMYANPQRRDPAELPSCDYCGEWWLSYMPPASSVTIDASVQEATLLYQGVEQSAMHLLYGSGGNPVEWPEMECGVEYVLAVDLDTPADPLVGIGAAVITTY